MTIRDARAAAAEVRAEGFARLGGFVPDAELASLRPDDAAFVPLEQTVGRVRQAGWFAQAARAEAPEPVQRLAARIEAWLAPAAGSAGLAPLAAISFNEVTWQRYAPGHGHISAHRDQRFYRTLIAIVTLAGRAPFSVLTARDPDVVKAAWTTEPGDLVLLRAAGYPGADDLCPLHVVGEPEDGERLSLTYRHNQLGPGGGWGGTRDQP